MAATKLIGPADRALHALGVRSASHLGAQGTHDDYFFFGKTLGDEQHNFVTALHTDQGQADAGVAGGGFDDRASGLELPFRFSAQNDSAGGAIFHAAAGVQVFQLGKDVRGTVRDELLQLQDGSVADQLGNVVSDAQALALDAFCLHPTGYGSGKRSVNWEGSNGQLAIG